MKVTMVRHNYIKMQKSQIDNLTWSFDTNENSNSHDPWTELNQRYSFTENDRMLNLNNFEYPELGDRYIKGKKSIIPREVCLSTSNNIQILLPMEETSMEPKRSKFLRRYKKSNKICINLQEALQNTLCANKMNKQVPKLRINLYMGNLGFNVPSRLDKNKCSDLRKVRICISKDKKPSKLKRIILLNRNMKAQINNEKREEFERKKVEAICRDVDTIDFNALKISAEPEIDYVRNMWTMALYDKNYRNINDINISDNTLCHRPDVIERINDLGIQGMQLTNRLVKENNRTNFSHFITDIIENDIVKQTLSLQINDDIKSEVQTSTEIDDKNFLKFSRNFRE